MTTERASEQASSEAGSSEPESLPVRPISIPMDILPADGRFGSGPSKVRPESLDALVATGAGYLGTSHRQAPVKSVVARLRAGMADLFGLPEGYEIVLGNGGTNVFWDIATFGLIETRSQHLCFGEFSSRFAAAVAATPHLGAPEIIESPVGTHPLARAMAGVDLYALTHNETSTGVMAAIARPPGGDEGSLVAVDATSAAGGLPIDPAQFDVYYFAPQKCFASDGGVWIALMSPAALDRVERIKHSGRWMPPTLDLSIAVKNSRLDQTYNTPALATVFLLVDQLEWMLGRGGLEWCARRCETSAHILYGWAEASEYCRPFVAEPGRRSTVVGTIDFEEEIDAGTVAKSLRHNGIVDTESYRGLHRNQLRIGMFPAIDPADIEALTGCIDYVVANL